MTTKEFNMLVDFMIEMCENKQYEALLKILKKTRNEKADEKKTEKWTMIYRHGMIKKSSRFFFRFSIFEGGYYDPPP